MPGPVVVGVDDLADGGPAVIWAEAEATLRSEELVLLHADGDAVGEQDARQTLGQLAEAVRARNPELAVVNARFVDAGARDALSAAAGSAGLLVVGSRGTGGFPGLRTGSTSLHVAAAADCPVVVVPDSEESQHPDGPVVVGVDAKDPDEAVLSFAFEEARRLENRLLAVHTWRYPLLTQGHEMPPVYEKGHIEAEQERLLAEVLAGWRQRFPSVEVEPCSVRSAPAKELVALSADARLLVVGRHGHHAGALGRLGSVSLAVVQHARCPVAVVPLG